MDIKIRQGGPEPSAAVVVCTIRGLKWHGGVKKNDLTTPNEEAVAKGASNLRHAIGVVQKFGLPAVVAINRFPDDSPEEIAAARRAAEEAGAVSVAEAKGFAEGGAGMTELAEAVVEAIELPSEVSLLYDDDDSTFAKVDALAKGLYKAGSVSWGPMTRTTTRRFESNGWKFPICMAKTHLSVSTDAKLLGAPEGHELAVREVRVAAGARQTIVLAGNIITLPGLPSKPNAFDIDLTDDGEVVGLLGT
jgi:formate--tetrahydrofolate ligase